MGLKWGKWGRWRRLLKKVEIKKHFTKGLVKPVGCKKYVYADKYKTRFFPMLVIFWSSCKWGTVSLLPCREIEMFRDRRWPEGWSPSNKYPLLDGKTELLSGTGAHRHTHGHRRNTERLNDVSSHKKLTLELMHSFHEQTPLAFEWYPWLIIQKPELFISSAPNSLLKRHSLGIYRWIWRGFSGGTFSGIHPLRMRLLTNTKYWDQTTET